MFESLKNVKHFWKNLRNKISDILIFFDIFEHLKISKMFETNFRNKISNIFEKHLWTKKTFFSKQLFSITKIFVIEIPRTFYFDCSFISKTCFCDVWRFEIWDSRNIHDCLIIFLAFRLEFLTGVIVWVIWT